MRFQSALCIIIPSKGDTRKYTNINITSINEKGYEIKNEKRSVNCRVRRKEKEGKDTIILKIKEQRRQVLEGLTLYRMKSPTVISSHW